MAWGDAEAYVMLKSLLVILTCSQGCTETPGIALFLLVTL